MDSASRFSSLGPTARRLGLAAVVTLAWWALAGGSAGCRRLESDPPSPTPRELWRRAERALAAGEVVPAAEMFGQSLAGEWAAGRCRDVAVRIAAAGRPDLAAAFVADRPEPELAALARAIAIFRQSPPAGYDAEPGVVGVMAEALLAGTPPAQWLPVASPTRLTVADLAAVGHHWQKWLEYRRLFGAAEGPGPPAARVMVVWRLPTGGGPTARRSDCIVHPADLSAESPALVHLGSWRLGDEDLAYDAVALAGGATGPAELVFAAWRDRNSLGSLAVRGAMGPDGLTVQAASDPKLLAALRAPLTDRTLHTGRVVPRNADEAKAILHLAERLGLGYCVTRDGSALVAASPDGDTPPAVSSGQWLTDLAVYVRYGRAALR